MNAMPNIVTAEEWHASHPIFQIATNADGSPMTAEQGEVIVEQRSSSRMMLLLWGAAILGGGGLLLYALTRK